MNGIYFNDTNPPPLGLAYGPGTTCTLERCSVVWSVLGYRPSVQANALFVSLFSTSLIVHIYQGWRYKTWFFTEAVIFGCICEIIGYGGRLILYNNPFDFKGFIMQIVIITLGPAFMCGAIYVLLSQIIQHLCTACSRFSPRVFYLLFIPCDMISLILQAAGGGLSSMSVGQNPAGVTCTLAGLGFQVFTLTLFVALSLDYAIRYARLRTTIEFSTKEQVLLEHNGNGNDNDKNPGLDPSSDDTTTTLRDPLTSRFKVFVSFLGLAVVCILIRCCYRIAELKDGYEGTLFHDEETFISLESVMILTATVALNIAQPGPVLFQRQRDGPATTIQEFAHLHDPAAPVHQHQHQPQSQSQC